MKDALSSQGIFLVAPLYLNINLLYKLEKYM